MANALGGSPGQSDRGSEVKTGVDERLGVPTN